MAPKEDRIQIIAPKEWRDMIDSWRKKAEDASPIKVKIGRSLAIRILTERAVEAEEATKAGRKKAIMK